MAVFARLLELVLGPRGLDLGCGPSAHDMVNLTSAGYDVEGLDAIEENIAVAKRNRPELAAKLIVHDLREALPFADAFFDFAYCDSVIQHLAPSDVNEMMLPEAVRILKPGGVLQLVFKCGNGVVTVHDPTYDEDRNFQLYDPDQILHRLQEVGMTLVEGDDTAVLGGVLRCTDFRQISYCVMWTRKA
jgi:SAM-dependent methyltransferase